MKKIITKETITLVQNSYNELLKTNKTNLCVPYNINKGTTVAVGLIRVINHGKDSYLYLTEGANKTYMHDWKEDVGQIFNHDCHQCNTDGKYFTFTDNKIVVLLRRISDEEMLEFSNKGFDHVTLGDFHYTIIRVIPYTEYWNFNSYERPDDYLDLDTTKSSDADEEEVIEEEPEVESLSLFE